MVKFNWNQTGMPSTLVSRLGRRNEFAEFKTVLTDAGCRVRRAVDAEAMAQELVASGGRELVEMVRELTTALATAERELENANRRYARLTAELARRGIDIPEEGSASPSEPEMPKETAVDPSPRREPKSIIDGLSEWEEWNRKFEALLA